MFTNSGLAVPPAETGPALRAKVHNVGLATDPTFQQIFIAETRFPD